MDISEEKVADFITNLKGRLRNKESLKTWVFFNPGLCSGKAN